MGFILLDLPKQLTLHCCASAGSPVFYLVCLCLRLIAFVRRFCCIATSESDCEFSAFRLE